jgi:hypothetical protein
MDTLYTAFRHKLQLLLGRGPNPEPPQNSSKMTEVLPKAPPSLPATSFHLFLLLPTEIRLKIYGFALGGNLLHITDMRLNPDHHNRMVEEKCSRNLQDAREKRLGQGHVRCNKDGNGAPSVVNEKRYQCDCSLNHFVRPHFKDTRFWDKESYSPDKGLLALLLTCKLV